MKKHTKIYLEYFNIGEQDYIPSELSGSPAQDVHHIRYRSQLGKDNIENLIALTRKEHELAHSGKLKRDYLQEKHDSFMKQYKINVNK